MADLFKALLVVIIGFIGLEIIAVVVMYAIMGILYVFGFVVDIVCRLFEVWRK